MTAKKVTWTILLSIAALTILCYVALLTLEWAWWE
jgi:hypothetical protein